MGRTLPHGETQHITIPRLSRLEGASTVHSSRMKEIDDLGDQMQNATQRMDALQRALESTESERRASAEVLETRLKDELSIMATSIEVKSQDSMNTTRFLFEELERRLREELVQMKQDTEEAIQRSKAEVSSVVDEREKALHNVVLRLGTEHTQKHEETREMLKAQQLSLGRALEVFEQQLRDDGTEHVARQQETREALLSALDASELKLQDALLGLERKTDAKHKDISTEHKTSLEVLDAKFAGETDRVAREGDTKLDKLHTSLHTLLNNLDSKLRDDIGLVSRDQDMKFA